ncbi:hypothetical protein DLM45_05305 [Hyphomicrobium methylovorum]|uniref:hypothetical protein n=1 Tax=Hyphomicrobium methylovorum TaxID=84 RepID=UPI0015E6FE6F|nr:hypothetical protein [Hyphomicrobium methylovorum]MBA2125642.1 hypothetical protein [Hyphomicrobium methylovorum]
MANSAFEANPAFTKLGEDARKSVVQAFEAMSNWRAELGEIGENNSNAVFDKMAEAAKALGWPTDFVELSRRQMQNASKLQLQAVDQVMDMWEKQVKSFGTTGQFTGFPNFPTFGGGSTPSFGAGSNLFPGMPDFSSGAANPIQFWMQAAEMWQKGWQQAMSTWVDAQQNAMGKTNPPGGKSNSR